MNTLYFPQLNTGAVVQYPVQMKRLFRSIRNESADGELALLTDSGVDRTEWLLRYEGLTDAEAESILGLYTAARGSRRRFVFLNPASNLLRWSEDLTNPVWRADPLLHVELAAFQEVPDGQTFILRNDGQTAQKISQILDAPGWYEYCFSFYGRCVSGTSLETERRTASGSFASRHTLREQWQRFRSGGRIEGFTESVEFAVAVPPGHTVEVYGLQVEAQPTASEYKPSFARSGIARHTRFAQTEIRITTVGKGIHAVELRLLSDHRNT